MGMRISELECKEVVCISDGSRLGYVCDVIFEQCEGTVKAIVVPGRGKMAGLVAGHEEFVIPWDCICRIGGDIILVDVKLSDCRSPKPKPRWFGN